MVQTRNYMKKMKWNKTRKFEKKGNNKKTRNIKRNNRSRKNKLKEGGGNKNTITSNNKNTRTSNNVLQDMRGQIELGRRQREKDYVPQMIRAIQEEKNNEANQKRFQIQTQIENIRTEISNLKYNNNIEDSKFDEIIHAIILCSL